MVAQGYTLTYGEGGAVIGDFKYAFHIGVLSEPVGTIPAVLFSEFQLIFQATVCAIAVGGACERGRILPLIPFIFVRLSFRFQLYKLSRIPSLSCLMLFTFVLIYLTFVCSSGRPSYIIPLPIWSGVAVSSASWELWISPVVLLSTSAREQLLRP